MANYNEEDVQWLYDRMVDDGVDAGTIDDFKESLKSDIDRDWYHKRAKKMGLDVGDADEFKSWTVPDEADGGVDNATYSNGGTVVDQAVDANNRMTGRMPQDVQDASFNAPVYGQRVNPAGGQTTFTEDELAEQIAETQKMNQPTINATDTSGMEWTNAEVANMQNNRRRENPNKGVTYQQKESWTGSYARTPDEFGEMHYGWQRGDRVKRLDRRGLEFAGYGGHKGNQFYNEALDAAERMSDDEIVATYEKMAKGIGPNTDMKWFVGTEEGYKLASQMKALQHELHARDLGFAHDRDVENPGMEDYANVRTDNVVAGVIDNIQDMSPQERDALAQAAYDRGLDSDMSEADQNVILAVAALRSKDNGRRVEDNYRELQQQVEYHSLYSTLERDMDRIYSEENAAMVQREEDAVGGMVYSGGEGGELAWVNARTVEAIKAGNLPHTFGVMTDRILQESEAAQRFYQRRVGELSKGEGIIRARAMARDELRQMFRTKYIDKSPLTPKSDTQYIVQSVFFDNMWSKMSQASLGLAAGEPYHEMKRTLDEGMQIYAKQQASTAARIIAPCAVLVFDAATGSFMPASGASRVATGMFGKGVTKGLSWLGKRLYGIGTEAALRRAGENTALRILGGALGGSANFATYEFESELFGGAASGTLSAGNLGHAALSGAGKGFVFGFVGGVASKATEGLSGMGALLGEVGTIAAEGTTFTAMDYLQTGQLTPESVGTSFGMAIAGRAAHPVEYATNLLGRVVGLNRKNAPSKPPRISKETAARLQNDYPALTALLSGDGLAKDIAKAIKTKGGKQDAGERLNAIEEEYRRMKQDANVPWSVVRIAEYVVNGRIIPQPWMMNSEIRTDEDGNEYGVTLDGDGRVIERFKFKDDKQREQWRAATSRQSDINRLSVASQNMRRSEFTDVLESTINDVAEAQGMDANVLRDIILGGDLKKDKAYRKTIKDKAYLSAADDVQKAVDEKLKATESAVDIAIRAVENKYGISIEQALEYPVYQRTEREAKAVEELQQRLNGDYAPENDMSDAEIIEAEKKRSHDDGYQAEGEQLADVKERLEDAADVLAQMRIDPRQFDGMDDQQVSDWLENRGNNPEEAEAVMEYLNAKAAFDGVRDKVNDEATERIEQTNRETDERTNKQSGQIHRVMVKPDNENDPGREAFVIDGKIAINEDGTVDRENSDKEVIVSYGDGSEPEMRPIEDVLSGEQPQDPGQLKQEAADGIVTEVTEKAASQMNRDLPFNEGDVYDVMIEGQPAKAKVVGEDPQQPGNVVVDFSNGQRGSVPRDALQGMADEYREAQRRPQQPVEEEVPAEKAPQSAAIPEQPAETPVAQEPRPAEERPAAPAIGGDPMERVVYYRMSGKSEERIEKEIANGIEAARQRLEKAQKAWDETKETDDAKLDALERELNDARREVEYWQEVDRYRKASQEPENARTEEPLQSNDMENRADEEQQPQTEQPRAGFTEEDKRFWSREGEDVVEIMDEAAKQMGLGIVTYDDPNGENGYIQNGVIYLNSAKGHAAVGFVMGHELTHEMQRRDIVKDENGRVKKDEEGNPENGNLYTHFRELALEHAKRIYRPQYVDKTWCQTFDEYVEARLNKYKDHIREDTRKRVFNEAWNSGMDNDAASATADREANAAADKFTMDDLLDEVTADVAGSMFTDNNLVRDVLGIENDLTWLQRQKEAIMDWLEKTLARMTGHGEDYQRIKDMQKSLQDLWDNAVRQNRGDRTQDQDKRYSLDTMAQQFGLRFEKDRDGVSHFYEDYGRDADGNPIMGREITKFMPIHIECSPVGAVLKRAMEDGIISKKQYDDAIRNQCAIMQYMKDTQDLDMFFAVSGAIGYAQMPEGGNERVMRDYYRMDSQGNAVFVPYKSNSETQYGNTFDVTTICRKTQTMIDVMSETMKAQKHGLTVDEVIKIVYDNVYKMGRGRNENGRDIMVPCNVCYVFNRWVNLGNLFDTMRQLRDRYADKTTEQIKKDRIKNIQALCDHYKKEGNDLEYRKYADYLKDLDWWANATVRDKAVDKANGDVIKNKIESYGKKVAGLMEERLKEVDQELDALAFKLFNYERAAKKADADKFTAADRKRMEQLKDEKNFLEKGTWFDYVRLQDDYQPIPDDILFDINRSYEFKEHYAGAWKYRTTRGSGMGKAAAAYSPEYFGSGIVGAAMDADAARDMSKNLFMVREPGEDGKWHYKYIDEETWTLKPDAVALLRKAQDKAAAQNYLNGQRFQSTSDARVEYLTDYNTYMLEQMVIGSKGQGFTKVPECAKLFGDTGTMFNLSLIAKGKGYEDITQEQYDALSDEDKRDCAMIDGVWRHALYSDVSGINHGDAFALSDAYPNLQPIMVTINNIHARLCMALAASGRITFNIPYHASGDTESYYLSKAATTGDSMDMTSRADYSDYETDKVIDPSDKTAATARSAFAKIKTGAKLTDAEMDYLRNLDHDNVLRQLYMRFRGEDVDGGPARILNKYLLEKDRGADGYGSFDSQCRLQEWDSKTGEYLTDADGNPIYKQVKLSGGKDGTANLLMTNDYWDKTLTLDQADQNGQAFLDLCEQLGYRPRFSGWKKDKNKGWMYDPEFDFTKCTGYWSNLIDISMYDQQGRPIEQGRIDASAVGVPHFDKGQMTQLGERSLTPMEANPNIGSEVMRDIVRQNVTDVAARRAKEKAEFAQIVRDWSDDKRSLRAKGALFGGQRGDIIPTWIRNEWDRNPEFVKEIARMAKLSPEKLEQQKARNIEDAIQHAQDTMDEYYREDGEADAAPRFSLVDDPVERKRMADVEFGRMGEEERMEFIDESRRFSLSTDLGERFGSRWIDEQTEESGKHTTQVPSTIGSYRKFADFVKRDSGGRDDIRVLDASSGLGHGTRWMRENGINAEDVEPYPSKDRGAPTYASYDDVKDDYDYIISNCVLNVIPEDWRRDVLHNMADKLKVGGKMIINVRGADSIRKQGTEGKSRITLDDPSEILVLRPNGSIRAYQKGFTKQELKDWCGKELGDGYQVEVAGKKNAGDAYDTAVVVTRTSEGGKRYSLDDKYRSKTDEEMASGSVPFNGNLRGDKESRFKVIDDENKRFLNWRGNEQKRYKRNVGKEMGNGVYVHKDYAEDIVPADVLEKAKAIAEREGFKYNSVYYEKKKPNMVRFDEAPDFDTAREPIPGKWMWVDTETGNIGKTGESKQIWHNKWMWVKDDYKGFDVNEAYEWSKRWNQEISNPDGLAYKWDYLLRQAGLPVDWSGSALGEDWNTDPDNPGGGVRFSLSEGTQKIFDTAKRKFGETKDIREAGYVLPDGTMLDFSGRHELDPGSDSSHLAGSRHTDHRAINQIDFVYDENGDEVDTGVKSDMPDFIKRGAIRIDASNGLINLSAKPTAEQRKVLRQLVAENGGTVDVDFGDGWDTDHSVYYDNTKPAKVLGDIDRYFDEGIKPQSNARFSLSDDVEPWQSEQVSWERSALDHLLQNAANNEENRSVRSQAVQAVNSTLRRLFDRMSGGNATANGTLPLGIARATRGATTAQRGYDRWTVDSLVSMAKSMLKSGMYDGLSPYEVNRLIGKINQGAGRDEIQEQMNTVFDVLMNANLRGWDKQLRKLTSIRDVRLDSHGVRVMGQVDKMGSVMLRSMRSGMELSQEDLERRIAEVSDRLASDNSIDADNAAVEMEGLILAQQYNDLIGKYEADNKAIKDQVREQLEKIYDFWREPNLDEEGNIIYRKDGLMSTTEKRRLKPEFGGVDENGNRVTPTEEAKRMRQQVERVVASLESARRENQVRMSEGYAELTNALGGGVAAAVTRAKEFRENEKLRKQEIYHAANSDLLDVDNTTQDMDPADRSSAANNGILRFFLNPIQTFDKMIRFFGRRSAYGEGRLFNKFMRGQAECSHNEWNSFKAGLDEMDAKADELFGMRWMKLGNAMRDGKKFPPIQVTYWDNNNRVTRDLRQDEAAYIYCVNKMRDGQMKLEAMGIDDAMVEQIVQQLDPRLIQLADWYQGEFLPKRRDYYNQVYERMFGTPMARIENYIHLNINQKSVAQNKELSDRMAGENSPSTITGSLKERKTNVTPIKLHTSLLDLAMQEHQKMEHWAAWGEYNRDLKDLINYSNFRAKVSNLSSKEFGSGSDLMRSFEKCAAIVTGDYQPAGRKSGIDTYAANWAKFVATAKIAFRPFTALKQTLSFPAFMSEARPDDLLKATLNPKGSVEWAMKNLPGFAKRWQSRQAGDTRLMETDSDWNVWRNSTVQKLGRAGLWMNAGVDCMTVAVGARGVYETAKRRYLSYGYSEAKAEKKALEDASIAYNASQQSSEGAFTSAQQTDRTIMSIATTCFRNASMGYERRFTTAVRNLKRMAQSGYREDVIENTKKQMTEEGLTEEQAERAAERVYNRMKYHSMMDIANFGFVLPFLWNLGPALIYILGGNDDEQKKELLRDSALHATFGPIEGLTFGGTMSELANIFAGSMLMDGENFKETMQGLRYRNFVPLPIMSDIQGLYGTLSTDAWSGVNDIVNLLVQAGTGVNPETFTDMGVALIDACNGDLDLAKETGFFMMRLANMPKSQVDKIYMDELGLSSEEGAKMSWEELARRYAKYNARKDAPLAAALLSDEAEAAREERYVDRFWKRAKEKLEKADDGDLQRVYGQGEEQKKMVNKEMVKRAGLKEDRYGEKPDKKAKSETVKAIEAYQRKRSYSDMAEDILLQKAKADAANAGDEERANDIEKALDAITKARKGMGVDKETDKKILEQIREARKKALKELKITR